MSREQAPTSTLVTYGGGLPASPKQLTYRAVRFGRLRNADVADELGILTHRVKTDMKNFKEFIESCGHGIGAWRGNIERPDQIRPDEA